MGPPRKAIHTTPAQQDQMETDAAASSSCTHYNTPTQEPALGTEREDLLVQLAPLREFKEYGSQLEVDQSLTTEQGITQQ